MPTSFGISSETHGLGTAGGPYPVKMDTSGRVNFAIETARAYLQNQGWALDAPIKATGKFLLDYPMPLKRTDLHQGIVIRYVNGYVSSCAIQVFDVATEVDPTGTELQTVLGDGRTLTTSIIGVGTTPTMTQIQIVMAIQAAIANVILDMDVSLEDYQSFPGTYIDGLPLSIVLRPKDVPALALGPYYNDFPYLGDTFYSQGITTKNGGWQLVSTHGDTVMELTLTNNENSNFTIRAQFRGGPHGNPQSALTNTWPPRVLMHKRDNYMILAGPSMFIITPLYYKTYVGDSAPDVLEGTDDYWLCAPFVPEEYKAEIPYCGFQVRSSRFVMNSFHAYSVVGDKYFKETYSGLPDTGMSIVLYDWEGVLGDNLTTPTGAALIYSAMVQLSPGLSFYDREHHVPYHLQPLSVVGYLPDMFLSSIYYPINAEVIGKDGLHYIAYKSQTTPCAATLFVRLPT